MCCKISLGRENYASPWTQLPERRDENLAEYTYTILCAFQHSLNLDFLLDGIDSFDHYFILAQLECVTLVYCFYLRASIKGWLIRVSIQDEDKVCFTV